MFWINPVINAVIELTSLWSKSWPLQSDKYGDLFMPLCIILDGIFHTTQKMKFSIEDFFSKCDQVLNEKLHFFVQCQHNSSEFQMSCTQQNILVLSEKCYEYFKNILTFLTTSTLIIIFGTISRNHAKLGRTKRLWYILNARIFCLFLTKFQFGKKW